ncbi:hypothetical protein SBA6_1240001 [Candidatus Sulfopaludibacter sp. SbA6]|nr:hypothetical protein SBA6_1240001 [Candidatus Sulfopaludibacter sp. SbA6]
MKPQNQSKGASHYGHAHNPL